MSTPNESPYSICKISSGCRTVIEAAAGTGKTHNITEIAARIIMERSDVPIEKMVIVTFTRAAAGELKNRISQRLATLENALHTGTPDELLDLALKKVSREEIRQRLRLALLNFDQAMIGTIHSFAMRSLSEDSFSGDLKFGFTLNEQTPAIVQELCKDFFRGVFYDGELSKLKSDFKCKFVTNYVAKRLADPNLDIRWQDTGLLELNAADPKESACRLLRSEMLKLPALEKEVEEKEEIKKAKEEEKKAKEEFVKTLRPRSPERAEAQKESDAAKTAYQTAKDELEKAKENVSLFKNRRQRILCESAFSYVSEEYKRICREKNFLGNDDLILEMARALTQGNSQFAENLRKKFLVGLIDEFQDTNDSQFTIFREVFLKNPSSTFIVVGDPRQAIYRFRSGDIQSYINAKKEILASSEKEFFSMNLNRRSGKKYIEAINTIFLRKGAFAMDDMDMPEQSALEDAKVLLKPDGTEIEMPIQTTAHDLNYDGMCEKCADDIEVLLKSRYQLPQKENGAVPVDCGDIAVLVTTWHNADLIKEALRKRNIPARLLKNPNVFSTPEAEELQLFLEGLMNSGSRDALYRALVTPLGDLEMQDLSLAEKIEARAQWLEELKNLWHKRSFMVMFNQLLIKFRVHDRLSVLQGGERSLSNFGTIADILAEEEFTRKLTPGAILRSLQKHILHSKTEEELSLYPARPETDAGCVVINTIFGSKGLKYPVVFLPDLFYLGKSFEEDRISRTFHEQGKLCFAPEISAIQKSVEFDELIQENLRKAYVAFTRAQYFCRFYCPQKQGTHCTSIDWLFREHGITENFTGIDAQMKGAGKKLPKITAPNGTKKTPPLPWNERFNALKTELEAFPSTKVPEAVSELRRRPDLMPYLLSQRGFLSFSSITPHTVPSNAFDPENKDEGDEEESENSSSDPVQEQKKERYAAMGLPSGTNFGNAVHKIMEICDYALDEKALSEIVARQLKAHGIPAETHGDTTTKTIFRMLNTPVADCDGNFFKLSEIDPREKKCEFEFLYEFGQKFATAKLFEAAGKIFSDKFGIPCPEFTEESSTYAQGFFNGSIDLFFRKNGKFYIVDWKTNKLANMALYQNETLKYAMAGSRYYLQYMIYTAALFKYLKERLAPCGSEQELYDKYFGGVRYLFLRGFAEDQISDRGVFSDRLTYDELKVLEGFIG